MDEQIINSLTQIISGLINQNAVIEAANKAYYASIIAAGASIFVCIITAAFNLFQTSRIKQKEYINDYYKYIVSRRIAAYEQLEKLIASIKNSTVDTTDGNPYHIIFSSEDMYLQEYNLLLNTSIDALWLSEKAFDLSINLNYILLEVNPDKTDIVEFGKKNYVRIATLREQLEKTLAIDMMELHDVEKFLKVKKKRNSGFGLIKIAK